MASLSHPNICTFVGVCTDNVQRTLSCTTLIHFTSHRSKWSKARGQRQTIAFLSDRFQYFIFSPLPQEILHNLRANGLHPGSNAMKRSLMKLVYLGLWTTYWRVLRQSKTCFLFFVIATCRFGHLSFFCHLGLPFFLRLFFFWSFGVVNFLSHAHACQFVNVLFCGELWFRFVVV